MRHQILRVPQGGVGWQYYLPMFQNKIYDIFKNQGYEHLSTLSTLSTLGTPLYPGGLAPLREDRYKMK